jgi:hypothetical protein
MTVPGSRDEALTDDIIEAATKVIAARAGWERGGWWHEQTAREVVAAVVPRLQAHIEGDLTAFAEKSERRTDGLNATQKRLQEAFAAGVYSAAARVARGRDHA